jgi:hypothetical protein
MKNTRRKNYEFVTQFPDQRMGRIEKFDQNGLKNFDLYTSYFS